MTYLDPAWRDRHSSGTDAHNRLAGVLERLAVMLEEEESSPEGRRADSEVWKLLRAVMQDMGIPCPEPTTASGAAS